MVTCVNRRKLVDSEVVTSLMSIATGSVERGGVWFYFHPSCQASGLCTVLFLVPGIYLETYVYDDVGFYVDS